LIIALIVLAGSAHAQDGETRTLFIESNVRSCASSKCDILFVLPEGTQVLVLGTEAGQAIYGDNTWLLIEWEGQEGYISQWLTYPQSSSNWKELPVIPTVSATARAIYAQGLQMGNNPAAFSKVGDCQSIPHYFMGPFDSGLYSLAEDQMHLQATIDHFAGSFERAGLAVSPGFDAIYVLDPQWANPSVCAEGESPLACEVRVHNPSIAIVSLEEWWGKPVLEYEAKLREIVEHLISQGVVPILATKADNLEGNHAINATIAYIAEQYNVPLWNFWLAVQDLPNHGMKDGFHITFARPFFDQPGNMQYGWPVRNLTALQALDAVWRGVQ
jgi:hypothetical protein